jgi:SAM-dependent methyltransferase
MLHEGDLHGARERFINSKPSNLVALLEQRYSWMNQYLDGKQTIIEVGSGAGFSRLFLNEHIRLTDYEKHPWVDEKVDALKTPYEDSTIDVVISSHMIHHLAHPPIFFKEMRRILRPGGYLLIQELNTSAMMRALLRVMRHEGWSYDTDVFDSNVIVNDPRDPWSANCAIPELLFRDQEKFTSALPGFRFLRNELNECILFPISGGVIAKTPTINLPNSILKVVARIDRALVRVAPSLFALGRSVVLQKT